MLSKLKTNSIYEHMQIDEDSNQMIKHIFQKIKSQNSVTIN